MSRSAEPLNAPQVAYARAAGEDVEGRHGPTTQAKYQDILGRDSDPVSYYRELAAPWVDKKGRRQRRPLGTLLPVRAAVLAFLVAEGFTEADIQALSLPRAKGQAAANRRALSADELAAYLKAVRTIQHPVVPIVLAFLPRTGLRISEAVRLGPDDIIDHPEMGTAIRVVGKGAKVRFVPLVSSAMHLISRLQPEGQFYFPNRFGTSHILERTVQQWARGLAERDPRFQAITPHSLRATYATLSLGRGATIRDVQQVLGHSDVKTTMRYLQPTASDVAARLRDAWKELP